MPPIQAGLIHTSMNELVLRERERERETERERKLELYKASSPASQRAGKYERDSTNQ